MLRFRGEIRVLLSNDMQFRSNDNVRVLASLAEWGTRWGLWELVPRAMRMSAGLVGENLG